MLGARDPDSGSEGGAIAGDEVWGVARETGLGSPDPVTVSGGGYCRERRRKREVAEGTRNPPVGDARSAYETRSEKVS